MACLDRYVSCVNKTKYLVMLFWLAFAGVGGWQAGTLFSNLEDDLDPPHGSQAAKADAAFAAGGQFCFPFLTVLLVESLDGSDVRTPFVQSAVTNVTTNAGLLHWSFYDALTAGVPSAADMFVSASGASMFVAFPYGGSWTTDHVRAALRPSGALRLPSRYRFSVTSTSSMDDTCSGAAEHDLGLADSVSIPLALLLLAWRVRSLPALVTPVVCLLAALLSTFAVLGPLSSSVKFPSFSPSLFVSVSVALAFDYGLFLLTRYREATDRRASNTDAVTESLRYAGHTCVVSGVCLCVAFASLMVFPVKFLSAIGVGASITVLLCIASSTTLTPALLLAFPRFFRLDTVKCVTCRRQRGCMWCCRPAAGDRTPSGGDALLVADGYGPASASAAVSPPAAASPSPHKTTESFWAALARCVVAYPWTTVIVILVVGSPLTYYSTTFKYSIDQNQLRPYTTSVAATWRRYREQFASGLAAPYVLVATPAPDFPDPTLQGDLLVFDNNYLIATMADRLNIPRTNFYGPTWVDGQPLNASAAIAALAWPPQDATARLSQFMNTCNRVQRDGNGNPVMFYTTIATPFDPQGPEADDFIRRARAVVEEVNRANPSVSRFYLALGLVDMEDVVAVVYRDFPWLIVATFAVLLIIVGASFCSVTTPIRLIFTVAVTLSWCFGGLVVVFQTSLFNWASDSMATVDALFWMGPVLTMSLIIGLSVDYDVFLTSRVKELRGSLPTTQHAVIEACARTGPIITTAGGIMFVAFGSLMTSSQMLLVQAGFAIAFSILLDTLVVRLLLVPALMALMGDYNWWPRKPPHVPAPTVPGTDDYLVNDTPYASLLTSGGRGGLTR